MTTRILGAFALAGLAVVSALVSAMPVMVVVWGLAQLFPSALAFGSAWDLLWVALIAIGLGLGLQWFIAQALNPGPNPVRLDAPGDVSALAVVAVGLESLSFAAAFALVPGVHMSTAAVPVVLGAVSVLADVVVERFSSSRGRRTGEGVVPAVTAPGQGHDG